LGCVLKIVRKGEKNAKDEKGQADDSYREDIANSVFPETI